MALINQNVTMTFTRYEITDSGVTLTFVATNPGPGQDSEYTVTFTQAELDAISTMQQFATAVTTKLQRKLRGVNIAAKLDPRIGQSVVI